MVFGRILFNWLVVFPVESVPGDPHLPELCPSPSLRNDLAGAVLTDVHLLRAPKRDCDRPHLEVRRTF